jgi:hypothetical protein
MTDAAIPITQSTVEQFTEQYLSSLGSTIEKHGDKWEVTVPEEAETAIPSGRLIVFCGDAPTEVDEDERLLHPESSFFQEVLDEVSRKQPTGKVIISSADAQIELPQWLQRSTIDVSNATFSPYYDRSAVAILYRISIETVSEYQTELLRATAIDARSLERLPKLEETVLESTLPSHPQIESRPADIEQATAEDLIAHTRTQVVEDLQTKIDDIHQEASRAADAEVEEYRRMQQQRLEELEEEKTRLSNRIDDLSKSIQENSEGKDRIEALQTRKELKSEYEEIDSEVADLKRRRDKGFPEKQGEIRERHALEVIVTPLTMTQLEYERGEIEIELVEGTVTRSLTLGYGTGVGVTEDLNCDLCGQIVGTQNPLKSIQQGVQCSKCYSE